MRKGQVHTEEAKRKIGEAMRTGAADARLVADRDALRLMGQIDKWEFAEKMDCSEQVANLRLRRLVEAGWAERFRRRGAMAYTYVMTVKTQEIG